MARQLLTVLALTLCSCFTALAQKAAIGTDYYNTLDEAVAAASGTNATVTLLEDDLKRESTLYVSGNVTLDLNGHTISAGMVEEVVFVEENTTLNIMDSKTGGCIKHYDTEEIDNSGEVFEEYAIYVSNGSTLNLYGGTVEANTYINTYSARKKYPGYSREMQTLYGIYNNAGAVCNIKGGTVKAYARSYAIGIYNLGTVNMTSGTIDTYSVAVATGIMDAAKTSAANVDGGTIYTHSEMAYTMPQSKSNKYEGVSIYANAGTVNVSNGDITTAGRLIVYGIYGTSQASINVYGGNFRTDATLYSNYDVYCANSSRIKLYGGNYSHDYYLKRYAAEGKYVNSLESTDERYKAGYCCEVSDKQTVLDYIAKNMTTETTYTDLPSAISAATQGDVITLCKDYTLTQDLTIPQGVTLLIPCDSWNTNMTDSMCSMSPCEVMPQPFRTLTIADGKTLTANGRLCVAARLLSRGNSGEGCASTSTFFGNIKLGKDANIIVNDTLYCWGYIHGEGTVTINKGAKLNEAFNILDWRGGDRTSTVYTKMFPVMQYQIQNVESKLVVKPGAMAYAASCITIDDYLEIEKIRPIPWISNNDAFFTTDANTTVIRTYNSEKDSVVYNFDNDVALGGINLYFDGTYFGDFYFNSKDYRAHLMDNWILNFNKGTVTIPYKYDMLPGCRFNIAPEASMVINEGAGISLFDKDQWGLYCPSGYVNPIYYTAANESKNRAVRCGTVTGQKSAVALQNMKDAGIDVRGSIIVNGELCTTAGGADISCSDGNGKVVFAAATAAESDSVYMVKQLEYTWDRYVTTSAPLYNADGTTEKTINCDAGTTFTFVNGSWRKNYSGVKGDVNGDGTVDISDVNTIISVICGTAKNNDADVNGDGAADISDVNTVISIICGTYVDPDDIPGDIDGDKSVTIADVNAIINILCGEGDNTKADVDGDGSVTISDVNKIIGIICGN